jgi:hypothetical protein
LRRAKKKAAEKGQTLTSLIEEGLNVVLAEPARDRRPALLRLPISTASGGTLPGIDLNRSSDLEDEMAGL